MSQNTPILAITRVANADLSALQHVAVKVVAGNKVDKCGVADVPIGFLDNAPAAGELARVIVLGTAKVRAAGAFAEGDMLCVADADGKLDTVGAAGHVIAIALEAAGAEDDRVEAIVANFFNKAA